MTMLAVEAWNWRVLKACGWNGLRRSEEVMEWEGRKRCREAVEEEENILKADGGAGGVR